VECVLSVGIAPTRVWLWPNLLSLDAPVVAVLWQILFARCFQVPVDPMAAILLLLTVWLIYAADRALDAWRGECQSPRHEFYRRRWRALLPVWAAVLGLTGWLAAERLSPGVFERGAILLAAVGLYFALVHSGILRWPKEAAVGVLFALGASLVAWEKVKTPADIATILLFSGLCWMNCIAIQKWEGERLDWSPSVAALVLACAAGALLYAHRPVLGGAELASAFAFLLLDRVRRRLSADAVRVLADVALLSPVLFLPLARG
jgi:hypothetical protein